MIHVRVRVRMALLLAALGDDLGPSARACAHGPSPGGHGPCARLVCVVARFDPPLLHG